LKQEKTLFFITIKREVTALLKYQKEKAHLKAKFFLNRSSNLWNSLPSEVKLTPKQSTKGLDSWTQEQHSSKSSVIVC
jgi:hypothetical protein